MGHEQKDKALFDQIARQYAAKDFTPSSAWPRQRQLLDAVAPLLARRHRLGTVVDIGCGIGAPARYLAGHYGRYIGIDQSDEMVALAQQLHHTLDRVQFIAGNIKQVTLAETADTILAVGALHHMTDLTEVMAAVYRMAKPNAQFLIIEPQNGNPLIQLLRTIRGYIDPRYSQDQHFFSEEQLLALFTPHYVTELRIRYQGYFSTPFAQVIFRPQAVAVPLSRLAVQVDSWLEQHAPSPIQPLSFNIIVAGIFR